MQGPKQSKSRSHTKNTSFATLHLKRRPIKQHLRVLRTSVSSRSVFICLVHYNARAYYLSFWIIINK